MHVALGVTGGIAAYKAAELALFPIKVAMMVAIAADKTVAADIVIGFDALDHMHREGQACHPRCERGLIRQIEVRRGDIVDTGLCAQIVRDIDQEMRLLPIHQVDKAHGAVSIARQW